MNRSILFIIFFMSFGVNAYMTGREREVDRDCLNSCQCTLLDDNSVIMNCTERNRNSIGPSFPFNTTELLYDYNDLFTLDTDCFNHANLVNVTRASLKGSQIEVIQHGAFNGLPNVESIVLANNLITDVQVHTFQGLTKLKLLDLRGNKDFDCRTFDNELSDRITWTLVVLCDDCSLKCECTNKPNEQIVVDCQDQELTVVPSYFPMNTHKILLGFNRITVLQNYQFNQPNLAGLLTLNLENNSISVIEDFAFTGLDHIRYLNLKFNAITSLTPEICSKPKLKAIDMRGNKEFDCGTFKTECSKKQQKRIMIYCDAASKTSVIPYKPPDDGKGRKEDASEIPVSLYKPPEDGNDATFESPVIPDTPPDFGKADSGLTDVMEKTATDDQVDVASDVPRSTHTAVYKIVSVVGAFGIFIIIIIVLLAVFGKRIIQKIRQMAQRSDNNGDVQYAQVSSQSSTDL